MKLAICDNEQIYLDDLIEKCKSHPLADEVTAFLHPTELLRAIEAGDHFQTVLMDIDYDNDRTGIEYMEEITEKLADIPVIYVTNYTDRFVEQIFLKKANIIGFLKKPVQDPLLGALLEKCQRLITEKQQNELLLISTGKGEQQPIKTSEIVYLEIAGHSTLIHTTTGAHLVHEKLESILSVLPKCFCRIHKSFAINMDQVEALHPQSVELKSPQASLLPVSRSCKTSFKETYLSYIQSKL